jgi:LmbE family N-acetylglucosaminyl deacetylase
MDSIMINLNINKINNRNLKILCLGAHSDDIEIGCGGTLLRLLSENDDVEVDWVVLGSSGRRNREAVTSAKNFLKGSKRHNITVKNFKDGFFPYRGENIKNYFEILKNKVSPDLIFSHYRNDLHQDHSLISQLTLNTFRDHLIFEYEIIKYDGDISSPNLYVQLNESYCHEKVNYIMNSFKSQRYKSWFTPDAFFSVMRIRGIESRAPEGYAEGFYCRKIIL